MLFRESSRVSGRGGVGEVRVGFGNRPRRNDNNFNSQQKTMKAHPKSYRTITPARLALTVLLLASANCLQAASTVKGATLLVQPKRPQSPPISVSTEPVTRPMSCPKCQDLLVQVPDPHTMGEAWSQSHERVSIMAVS
jgi:hypothetical protein